MVWLGLTLAIICFVVGVLGTILPVLPGAPLLLLGMILYGVVCGFEQMSWSFFLIQILALILTFVIDYLANIWGVRRFGGSNYGVWGSIIGLILGVVLMGPIGIILGPFLGAVIGELLLKKSLQDSFKAGLGALLGLVGSSTLKLVIMAGMIMWFFVVNF